jgi:hypothetical protein
MRRDAHTCRYCGATAPDVKLTIDHVLPVTLGGSDEPMNLVTACADCNAGKSSIAPDSPIVDDVSEDALKWAAASMAAGAIQAKRFEERRDYIVAFDEAWLIWSYGDGSPVSRPSDWSATIGRHFEAGLEIGILQELILDVLPRNVDDRNMWRYFCGALRNVMQERAEITRTLIESGGH